MRILDFLSGAMYQLNFDSILKNVVDNLVNSYAPYSKFHVSACAVMKNVKGELKEFYGVNVENSSYGLTVCAERVAIFKGVSEGFKTLVALVLVASHNGEIQKVYPCGACRQVMFEFKEEDPIIYNGFEFLKLSEMLPKGFNFQP